MVRRVRAAAQIAIACLLLAGCDTRGRWAWVEDVPVARAVECPGGKVNIEKRIVDVNTARTRNTTVRTDACLE